MFGFKKYSDISLAIFVIVIIAMLVVPLPTFLLDILIVVNLSFALLILLVGLYMPNSLALLSFPTLLLLTTLFRLGLNVASTRLILSQGNAGTVIQAFGTFLVRGEVVVGMIIFTIITVVNFIVIARGSSRVSVVAARFTLDALPGKQMAIDSDLRAGLINNDEARQKRDDLRKESQLYGSMDGAMQFVQGDAIAGFFIILTNIFGGIYLGITRGQSFPDAISTYTILTVGDGLVTQIPALLISICAGIVVTRVSAGENTTLGADVGSQIFSSPITVTMTGLILFMIALVPGLPKIPFLAVGLMFVISGFLLRRRQDPQSQMLRKLEYSGNSIALLGAPKQQEEEFVEDQYIQLALDEAGLYRVYRQNAQKYAAAWEEFRADFYNEIGIRLPNLRISADDSLPTFTYSAQVSGTVISRQSIALDSVFIEVSPDSANLFGIDIVKEAIHPLTHQNVVWAVNSPSLRQVASAASLRVLDFFDYISLNIGVFYLHHPEEVVTLSEIHAQLKQLEKKFPGLVGDVLVRNFIDVPRLAELVQELVKQGVNTKDFKQVVEAVASYCSANGIVASDADGIVMSDLVSHIRLARKRQLIGKALSSRGILRVFSMSPELEAIFEDLPEESNSKTLAMEPKEFESIKNSLNSLIKPVLNRGIGPISLLVRSDLRSKLNLFIHSLKEPLRIITYDELEASVEIEQVGVWVR